MSWAFPYGKRAAVQEKGHEKGEDLLSRDQVGDWWLKVGTGQAKEVSALSSSLYFRTPSATLLSFCNCGKMSKASRQKGRGVPVRVLRQRRIWGT